jgi:hypothetical protein
MRDPQGGTWLDRPGSGTKIFRGLCILCVLLAIPDLVTHFHVHFRWEAWPLFDCVLGFASFWCIVIAGKHLRKLLWRPEDYYD